MKMKNEVNNIRARSKTQSVQKMKRRLRRNGLTKKIGLSLSGPTIPPQW
jgi:hypothetical protein